MQYSAVQSLPIFNREDHVNIFLEFEFTAIKKNLAVLSGLLTFVLFKSKQMASKFRETSLAQAFIKPQSSILHQIKFLSTIRLKLSREIKESGQYNPS